MANEKNQKIEDELEAIKKLLILALYKNGVTQTEIADALDVDNSTVSKMLTKSKKGTSV